MDLLVEKTGKKTKMKFSGTVRTLLSKIKINPETVIVVKNGSLVNEDEQLTDKDSVRIMSVISGG